MVIDQPIAKLELPSFAAMFVECTGLIGRQIVEIYGSR